MFKILTKEKVNISSNALRVTLSVFKKIFNILLILLFVNSAHAAEEKTNGKLNRNGCGKNYSSLVLEDDGTILFDTRAEKISYPASLTKVMTVYLTLEAIENNRLSLDQSLTVSAFGAEISKVNKNNTLRLKEGSKITVREAIQSIIVKSFNEAAVTLAEAVSGDEWKFVRKMNEKAEELGMIQTSFRNSTGLHAEGQYTTAYDLARLTIAIKRDFPEYYRLFALKKFIYNGAKYDSHNHVLLEYKGAEGMKTGFTNASGFNLISIAKKDDKRVISVLMGCSTFKSRDQFTKKLFDKAFFRNYEPEIKVKLKTKFDYNKNVSSSLILQSKIKDLVRLEFRVKFREILQTQVT